MHRKNVINELVTTEEKYIRDLKLVVEVFSAISPSHMPLAFHSSHN